MSKGGIGQTHTEKIKGHRCERKVGMGKSRKVLKEESGKIGTE